MEKNVFNQNQIEKIRFLQRLVRSFYVRRQFEQVRKEYLQTLSEIEGEPFVEEEKPLSNQIEVEVEAETIVEKEKLSTSKISNLNENSNVCFSFVFF